MTTLAETILRDVPRYTFDTNGELLYEREVLAALTAAMDPAIAEREGEVLDSLAVLADMADLFSAPLLDDDDKPEMTVALERIVAAVPALLAQNAALRAERDEHAEALKVNNAVLCAALLRAKDAEAQIAALPAATVGVDVEEVARAIYDAMRFERKDKTPEWVKGGNSHAQVEARAAAARILAALTAATEEGHE